MTDNEIQQLAHQYAEQNPPQTKDEVLKQYGMFLNATEVFEPFLRWLTKTHCIVSREKVKALHNNIHGNIMCAHDDDDWQEAAHYILDVMPRRFAAVFGMEIFEERNK